MGRADPVPDGGSLVSFVRHPVSGCPTDGAGLRCAPWTGLAGRP